MKNKIYILLPFLILFYGCSATKEVCKSPEVLDLSNDTMSYIKGGEFLMGDYNDSFGDKMPREVYVSSFLIDRTEVTNGLYKAYMDEKSCGVAKPKYIDDPILGADDLPVVWVNYKEAKSYCEFYNKRLPTEAEWEFAARGGLEYKKYPWGDKVDSKLMNYRDSKKNWSTPIMTYIPNSYYLYDMTGNVREWVEDSYEKEFYKNACLTTPLKVGFDLSSWVKLKLSSIADFGIESIYKSNCYLNPVNREDIRYKVNRGGSWAYSEGYPATVSFRTFDDINYRGKDLGFRCAVGGKKESWIGKKIRELVDNDGE